MMWYEQLVCGLPPPENRTFSLAPSVWLPNFELDRYANSARYVCDTHFTRRASLIFCRVKNKWLPSSVQFSFFFLFCELYWWQKSASCTRSLNDTWAYAAKNFIRRIITQLVRPNPPTLALCQIVRTYVYPGPQSRPNGEKKIPINAHQLHVRNTL